MAIALRFQPGRNRKSLETFRTSGALPWSRKCPGHQGALCPRPGPVPTQGLPMPRALIALPRTELAQEVQGTGCQCPLCWRTAGPTGCPFFLCLFAVSSQSVLRSLCELALGEWWTRQTAAALTGMTFEWEQRAMRKP